MRLRTWGLLFSALLMAAPAQAATRLAHIGIKGEITETSSEMALLFSGSKAPTLRELIVRIEKAQNDAKIDGLLVVLSGPEMGSAQAGELRAALEHFRTSGKKIHVYCESATMKDYVIATAADTITMLPNGDLDLRGMMMEVMHYKGLLDKLGIEADFLKMGRFKGAAEPLTDATPSDATREAMNALLDDMFGSSVDSIAAGRKLTKDQVRKLIDEGPYTSEEALAAKLIDRVAYWENFKQQLKQEANGPLTIVDNYGRESAAGPAIDFDNPLALIKLFSELMGKKAPVQDNSPKIALIYAEGPISSGESQEGLFGGKSIGSTTLNKALRTAREDPTIKAVVLRIDSPGGSALASDAIWKEVQLTAQAKPVIASMGNVAASGGYYIASAAGTIVAAPTTITGSIGVIGGKLVVKGLYDKLGLTTERFSRGQNAGMFSSNTKFSDSERKVIDRHLQKIYDVFLDRVAVGRNKDRNDVHKVAQGRVWSGVSAKQHGLVDELGGLDRALHIAADKANLRSYKLEILPKQKSLMDLFMEGFMGGSDARASARAAVPAELQGLAAIMPGLARPAMQLADQLRLFERERVLMVLPVAIEVK